MTSPSTEVKVIPITQLTDHELLRLSKENLLALNLEEMKAIQKYFKKIGREPTDVEIETIAQTWSEHCKHKTLKGRIAYKYCDNGLWKTKKYKNLLEETIFRATKKIIERNKGKKGFIQCVSVFKDNAGIVKFNSKYGIAFKVETHNHPSALEPYGGAATGIGGVIRDILGVGLGGKPIANTDVFCFGPLDYPYEKLPKGVLHPRRIFKGVVSGVRDYGNKMGIPTVNGAIIFDEGFICNPLVYCGTVGIIPLDKCFKKVKPGLLIVSIGGKTGRDGIHGATFSSTTLDKDTPLSPVQIGNPIVEKKFTDVLLKARDENLYVAITDCGGGGYSSAIGEITKDFGCEVYLEKVPLKYKGLFPWEIWMSESQERMILLVPKDKIKKLIKVFEDEDVEATVIGKVSGSKKLTIYYKDEKVCELSMDFLHEGLPKGEKKARWERKNNYEPQQTDFQEHINELFVEVLRHPNIASKEVVIRQYDHEVQGQTVIKPLHGRNSGPGDAAVVYPFTFSYETVDDFHGIAIACGINPNYGKIDPYYMAGACIDETLRNLVCVGANPDEVAILDNFCWSKVDTEEKLGSLVRAVEGCRDYSLMYNVPFISGKDSLNNEFVDEKGNSIPIPGTLLVSGIGMVPDIRKSVTMDFKEVGNLVYIVGLTKNELGGSVLFLTKGFLGNFVPVATPRDSKNVMRKIHKAIQLGLVRSCHDISDGGLVVALAEMCIASGFGADVDIGRVFFEKKNKTDLNQDLEILFSESTGRFIVEVRKSDKERFEEVLKGCVFSVVGEVTSDDTIIIRLNKQLLINQKIEDVKQVWRLSITW